MARRLLACVVLLAVNSHRLHDAHEMRQSIASNTSNLQDVASKCECCKHWQHEATVSCKEKKDVYCLTENGYLCPKGYSRVKSRKDCEKAGKAFDDGQLQPMKSSSDTGDPRGCWLWRDPQHKYMLTHYYWNPRDGLLNSCAPRPLRNLICTKLADDDESGKEEVEEHTDFLSDVNAADVDTSNVCSCRFSGGSTPSTVCIMGAGPKGSWTNYKCNIPSCADACMHSTDKRDGASLSCVPFHLAKGQYNNENNFQPLGGCADKGIYPLSKDAIPYLFKINNSWYRMTKSPPSSLTQYSEGGSREGEFASVPPELVRAEGEEDAAHVECPCKDE
eukprot:TRINITY_DN10023_c0_g1_i1.p1 TRINITY_DN10023_c0_g1~~TRINITY_DN10023_c0_g1_i1.p1  ORF type:complete len:333 (+),score=32.41 TRINITY_DN10023_c0_g1_i1:48-1046(+)